MDSMTDGLGVNTYISNPMPINGSAEEMNGANGPGSSLKPHHGVITLIVTSAALLVAIRVLFHTPTK